MLSIIILNYYAVASNCYSLGQVITVLCFNVFTILAGALLKSLDLDMTLELAEIRNGRRLT